MSESPPSLPAVVGGTPQLNFDALNVRAHAVETGAGIASGSITDAKLSKPVIAGNVKESGTRESGEGFAVERPATGEYKVTLTTELATLGSMVVTPVGSAGIPEVLAFSSKVFTVRFLNVSLAAINTAFSFHIKAT